MTSFFRIIAFLALPFLLSSCMKMDISLRATSDGNVHEELTIDISQMATMMAGFSGSSTESMNKDLCKDESFSQSITKDDKKMQNIVCTSLGDYKSRITGDTAIADMPQMLTMSGVTIFDAGFSQKKSTSSISKETWTGSNMDPKSLGFSITGKATLPWKIVYLEWGNLLSQDTVEFDFLDPKFQKRNALYVVSTNDGRRLSTKEINKYKLLLKKKIRESKKQ